MSLGHGASVVRNGSILNLDAANKKSYPGTGTTWNDLSGNGYNGSFVDGTTFVNEAGGLIRSDGLNDRVHFENPLNRWVWAPDGTLGNNTLSFELWTRSTDTAGRYFSRPWNGSGQYNYWVEHNSWYITAGGGSSNRNFSTLATGLWEHVCVIVTNTQTAVYRNGVVSAPFANHNVTGAAPTQGNTGESLLLMSLYPYSSGWAGNTNFGTQGDVSVFRAYNRVLTAQEVQQNFEATRGRYGV